MTRAKQALDQGAFVEAEHQCDEALRISETTGQADLRLARTRLLSAQVYQAQQKWDFAEKCYKEAITRSEAAAGPGSSELLSPLEKLAEYYIQIRRRYDLAVPLCERVVKILQAEPNPNTREIARQSSSLAGVYEKLERFDEAESLYHQSLRLAEKTGDDISGSLLVVADFYRVWGKLDCAEAMATRALELREKALGEAGEKSVELATVLFKLAEIYRQWDKPDRAEVIYNRCLAVIGRADELTSSAAVLPLAGRAAALRDQGKLIEAEADYRRALAVADQTMDPALPEVITLVDVYAGLLVQLHRNKEADTMHAAHQWRTFIYEASRELKANHLGEAKRLCNAAIELSATFKSPEINPSDAPLLLGEIYRVEGRYDSAEQAYTQALATCEKTSGPDAPALIAPLEALANFYYLTRVRYHQVIHLDRRILAIAEKAYAAEPGKVARRACNLADVFRSMRCDAKAIMYYKKAIALSEKATGDPGDRVQYLQALGDFYRDIDRFAEAEDLHRRSLALREKTLEMNSSSDAQYDVAVCLDALAEDYLAAKQPQKAEPLCQRSASIVTNLGGADNAELVPRLTRWSTALRSLGRLTEAEASMKQALSIVDKNPGMPEQTAVDESYAALLVELKRPEEAKALLARVEKVRQSTVAR